MNKTPVWTLQRGERNRIVELRRQLESDIDKEIDNCRRLVNELDNAIRRRENLKKALTLVEEKFKFDSQ